MEPSPLISAHDHARAALSATQNADTTVAINEHAQAAGEFAKAARGTGSAEALRTLKLLEQHHQKLSELLRYPLEHPVSTTAEAEVQAAEEKPLSTSAAVAELRASKSDIGPRPTSPLRAPPSLQNPRRRLPPRDLSSSIASNLASARGIRSNYTRQPLTPSVSTHQAPGSLESLPRKDGKYIKGPESIPEHGRPSWVPPTHGHRRVDGQASGSRASVVAEAIPQPPIDEGFSRFYSAVENILHKLSAPLAFAGLPLAPKEVPEPATTQEQKPQLKKEQSLKDITHSDPDLTKFISRAALRASARDGNVANDSFYVVPTSGHSVSYAHILSFAEKEERRLAASMHSENQDTFKDPAEEDDFVDARETPMPPSPRKRNSTSGSGSGGSSMTRKFTSREMENKIEELSMENTSLKDCVDKLSLRLRAFEMAAQNSSLALQESMRLMRPLSPMPATTTDPSHHGGRDVPTRADETLRQKVDDLETQLAATQREADKLSAKNEKLNRVVVLYRDRWEKLKEGAKTRREGGVKDAQSVKDGGAGSGEGSVPPSPRVG